MKNQGMIVRAISVAAFLSAVAVTSGAQQSPQTVAAGDPVVSVNIRNENIPARRIIDFTATPGSYVTVIRVTGLGVEVLYPAAPVADRAMIRSSKRVAVPKLPTTKNPLGAGAIFAFVSRDPYVFSKVADANGWNSLHLANYSAATDEAIAETFGNEITTPSSRVIMSKATTAPVAIISHDHSARLAALESFRTKTCPSTTYAALSVKGTPECLMFPTALVSQPVRQGPTPQQSREGTAKK